jgi:hypothetical protein
MGSVRREITICLVQRQVSAISADGHHPTTRHVEWKRRVRHNLITQAKLESRFADEIHHKRLLQRRFRYRCAWRFHGKRETRSCEVNNNVGSGLVAVLRVMATGHFNPLRPTPWVLIRCSSPMETSTETETLISSWQIQTTITFPSIRKRRQEHFDHKL